MAMNQHVYLMEEDENGKHTVYPVTDVNAIIGLGDSKGELLDRINSLEQRIAALEKKVNYH
ncbi:DUF4988 domain-containing protein [Limosilactobacillus reuteri]|uniref:DUF4988 domain-containing protein n=1 Tax=Limosilactobacillus reuteri TaxID=1598 RepID=UPI001C2C57C1|nr:DUF4988 domain-containing protein [Limosilactobacillus reuteri]MBV0920958.1 DUF4988 domain-containing protein [Limosilactobacillus reuteri]